MAKTDGDLLFGTKIDNSGFEKGISKLGGIGKVGLGILATGFTAVATGVTAAAVAGIKYNATMETYIANFETLLGSADKAGELVEDLRKMGAETPFEMADLAEASKTLLAFGEDVELLQDDLKMLGDISLGNSEKFKSIALVFGQIQSAGKLTGQDLLQLINVGFNPLQTISEKTGESMESLKDKMSKGQISFEMVKDAMKDATDEGGRFNDAMNKASTTFKGLVSTLKDNAGSLLGQITSGITESISTELLPLAIKAVEMLQKSFNEQGVEGLATSLGNLLSDALTMAVDVLPDAVDITLRIIKSLAEGLLANAGELSNALRDVFYLLIYSATELLPIFTELAVVLISELAKGLGQTLPILTPLIVDMITQIIAILVENAPLLIEAGFILIDAVIQGLLASLPSLASNGVILLNALLTGLKENGSDMLQVGIDLVTNLIDGIGQIIPNLKAKSTELALLPGNELNKQMGKIYKAGSSIVDNIKKGIESAWNGLVTYLGNKLNEVTDMISKALKIEIPEVKTPTTTGVKKANTSYAPQGVDISATKLNNLSVAQMYPSATTQSKAESFVQQTTPVKDNTNAIIDAIQSMTVKLDSREVGRIVVMK